MLTFRFFSRGGKRFPMAPVGTVAQELILAGGLEPWIKQQLAAASPRA